MLIRFEIQPIAAAYKYTRKTNHKCRDRVTKTPCPHKLAKTKGPVINIFAI
jgi:hypothetical protein